MRATPLRTPFQLDTHTLPIQTPPTLMIPPPSPPNLDVPRPLPTHLTYPRSFKVDLPDLSKIPLLSSGADWPIWFRGVSDMIDNLCLFHHISPEPAPGVFPDHLSAPSYLPPLLPSSSLTMSLIMTHGGVQMALCGTSSMADWVLVWTLSFPLVMMREACCMRLLGISS